ncbi:hypothetical protein K505DRAFT_55462 [Melanomma pulvis-pyrius CBS 109.77]|uniref:Uncharacterized protein n=1 Tax=Melanomma pulvis-pyrius CBS 109.77 TaxID=1314802 RepID=A0A6A6X8J7_9PLEO|nr:hypothetical protein K505DRAFT_55462 [Melanomma pulvis-pyrius CBS 109.77]
MPLSSSSTTSATPRMPVTTVSRSSSSSKYRVTEYHDGKVLRIHESCRRSHVTSLAHSTSPTLSTSNPHGRPIGAYTSLLPMEMSSSNTHSTRGTRSGHALKDGEPRLTPHVTAAAHVSPRAKAVIFQSPMPIRSSRKDILPLFETSGIPTPPPTPKIERLPTPELEDLDKTLFCDCCVNVRSINYCASCGLGLHQF